MTMHTELWIGWGELEQGTRRSENTLRKLEAAGAPIFRLGGTPCMRPEAWTEFLHEAESKAGSAGSEYQAAKAAADNLQKAVAAASDGIQKTAAVGSTNDL
jgi:hypothetical protein